MGRGICRVPLPFRTPSHLEPRQLGCSEQKREEAAADLPKPGWFSIFGVHNTLEFLAAHLKV